jgi:hypothetical protein
VRRIPYGSNLGFLDLQTERPLLVGEVSATSADRGVWHGQCGGSPKAVISVF